MADPGPTRTTDGLLVSDTCTDRNPEVRIPARYEGVAEMTMKRVETLTSSRPCRCSTSPACPTDLPPLLKFGPLGRRRAPAGGRAPGHLGALGQAGRDPRGVARGAHPAAPLRPGGAPAAARSWATSPWSGTARWPGPPTCGTSWSSPSCGTAGVGMALLDHALGVARDMYRKTLALRVDPANAPAVNFYRQGGLHHRGDGGEQEVREAPASHVARAVSRAATCAAPSAAGAAALGCTPAMG